MGTTTSNRDAAPKEGSKEQVSEANLTTEAPLNNRREQRRDIKSHDPRGLAVLYPTNQTHPSTPTIPPIQSPAKAESRSTRKDWIFGASRCKTRIKKSDKRVKITAWKKEPKIQSRSSRVHCRGEAKAYQVEPLGRSGARSERRRRRDAEIHQAARFLPPSFSTHPRAAFSLSIGLEPACSAACLGRAHTVGGGCSKRAPRTIQEEGIDYS